MSRTDLACIVIATAALTLAAALVAFHFYLRSYRRTLAKVRELRSYWWSEARNLRADRPAVHRTLAEHARTAVALTEPIPYAVVDRTAYLPAFEGDRLGYDDPRTIARKVAR